MSNILVGDFLIVLFIFIRVMSMMVAAPVLGNTAFPMMAKVFIAMIISYLTFFTIDKAEIVINLNLIFIAVMAVKEVVTGLIMGFVVNFIFYGVSYAGYLIGYDMGLMSADVFNPSQEMSNNVVGEFIFQAAIILFILINGHHHLITAVTSSFQIVPIGKSGITEPLIQALVRQSAIIFTIGVKIASPIMVSFFLIHVAEGIISRVIPNIQIFFVSQPVKIGIGIVFLSILVPVYIYAIKNFLNGYEDQLSEIIKSMSV